MGWLSPTTDISRYDKFMSRASLAGEIVSGRGMALWRPVVNFIDRVNVGFAALTMNKDLGFSPTVFGFGAGTFFFSYFLFQVPASVMLERVGARRGFLHLGNMGGDLCCVRLCARPGEFLCPAFPVGNCRGRVLPRHDFLPHSVVPARVSRALHCRLHGRYSIVEHRRWAALGTHSLNGGVLAIHGWQWMFLLEGLPASLLGFEVLKFLPNDPAHASWLTGASENPMERRDLWPALRDPRVFTLCLAGFSFGMGLYGYQLWLPQIGQGMGFSNRETGFIVALPYMAALGAMILWARPSDARGDRIWHVALPWLLAASGFALASIAQSDLITLGALTCVAVGILASFGPFYSLPSLFLGGTAAAGGIALVNSVAALGAFFGPVIIGVLKEQTGNYASAMAAVAFGLVLSAAIMLALGRAMAPRPAMVMPKARGSACRRRASLLRQTLVSHRGQVRPLNPNKI
jgi:MFS transporter, ACS family, tartrate transporter